MTSPRRRRNPWEYHSPRLALPIQGYPAVFLGLALLLTSLLTWYVHDEFPWHWLVLFRGAFPLAGLVLFIHGVRGELSFRRKEGRVALRREAPWRLDGDWDESGADDGFSKMLLSQSLLTTFLILFLFPFSYWTLYEEPSFLGAFVFLIDIAVVGCVFGVGKLICTRFVYGACRLRFNRFPFFLGERLEAELVNTKRFRSFQDFQVTLLCWRDAIETKDGETSTETYELYEDPLLFRKGVDFGKEESSIPLTFALPSEGKSTELSSLSPVYWEIEVRTRSRWLPYVGVFLVPVYAPSDRFQSA